jgi:CrcB protein
MAVLVGVLGAFTTFSTFELELYGLIKDGAYLIAFGYLFLSVLVGFIGVVAGISLAGKF